MKKDIRKRIEITQHAKQRFKERFPDLCIKNLQTIASKARYEGFQDQEFEGEFRRFLESVTHKDVSTQIRISNGKIFVFKGNSGHCRTLLTLYPVPPEFANYERFLIQKGKMCE